MPVWFEKDNITFIKKIINPKKNICLEKIKSFKKKHKKGIIKIPKIVSYLFKNGKPSK